MNKNPGNENNTMPDQAGFWDEFLKRDLSYLSRSAESRKEDSYYSQIFETNEKHVETLRGGNILEVGCGDGMDSVALALDYGCNVTAIDISENRVKLALENIKKFNFEDRISARIGDANALDFEDEQFDGVIGNSVMLFLDHDKAGGEIARVLRPGGRLVLTNESMPLSPLVKLSRKFGLSYRSKELESYVVERLTPGRIDELARKYFTSVDYTLHFGLLLQFFWGVRLLFDKAARLFKPGASYHKPDLSCPAVFKRIDRYFIEKWNWYRNRAWVVAVSFEK
jgi:ubiquinone/menaquinone biosynthesis C-methylase UbiE